MARDIELGPNHTHWMMGFYNHYVIGDHDADNRLTDEEKNERIKWCRENLIRIERYDGRNPSWCCSSQVNKWGTCPHWIFYFMQVEDAMAFKLRWL